MVMYALADRPRNAFRMPITVPLQVKGRESQSLGPDWNPESLVLLRGCLKTDTSMRK
jgi:hypothetical protein